MNATNDPSPRRRGPNVFVIVFLAVALPVAGVFLLEVYRNRLAPLFEAREEAKEQNQGDASPQTASTFQTGSAEKAAAPSPTAVPTPVRSPLVTGADAESAGSATPASVLPTPGTLAPGQASNVPAGESERRLVQREVLKRIDLMPNLSSAEQDKLYVQVERAQHMGCAARIAFAPGETTPSPAQLSQLCGFLKEPEQAGRLSDPTTVIVVLGYADKKGDDAVNLRISLGRADTVRDALRDSCGVLNVMHSVGMGSSELFGTDQLDKNRLVEVWLVVP